MGQGTQASFEAAYGVLQHTGKVLWSRPGKLDVLCRYSGLVNFPEDRLRCSFEIGGWFVSGAYQGIDLKRNGYVIAPKAGYEGAKSSYTEQSLESVNVTQKILWYDSAPNEPWPTLVYTVELSRNDFYYLNFTLLPSVIFSFMS